MENKIQEHCSKARTVAGSATYKQSKAVWNCVVIYGHFVYSDIQSWKKIQFVHVVCSSMKANEPVKTLPPVLRFFTLVPGCRLRSIAPLLLPAPLSWHLRAVRLHYQRHVKSLVRMIRATSDALINAKSQPIYDRPMANDLIRLPYM